MPTFFAFHQGHESSPRFATTDSTPLLGRYRALPTTAAQTPTTKQSYGDLFSSFSRNSIGRGYGSIFRTRSGGSTTDGDGDYSWESPGDDTVRGRIGGGIKAAGRGVRDIWVRPRKEAISAVVESWFARWFVVVFVPAFVAVVWCAIPIPQYELPDEWDDPPSPGDGDDGRRHHIPGHGEARVLVNFWFFLFVYYGFYNVTALMWITKVFNIYSLNWWPTTLGFPLTYMLILAVSLALPIPAYYHPVVRGYLRYNTAWIFWTFLTMALPVLVAFVILMSHERHLSLRNSLSETQRIFTQSWWTGEGADLTVAHRDRDRRRRGDVRGSFDPDTPLPAQGRGRNGIGLGAREALGLNRVWIPASFKRFLWFCTALSIGLLAYVLGETYAEIYLRTLPHNNIETVVYVYSWVITIHVLDGLTGWILGGGEGERVGSWPLGWCFKLYFSLTYQTYVRALYARLRSPSQFLLLQLLSSSFLIVLHPVTLSSYYHALLTLLGFSTQPYHLFAKQNLRGMFIRTLAENISMLAFLGQIVVLHFGANRSVYPYFSFDGSDGGGSEDGEAVYDFDRTVRFSLVTWACEICAAFVVRRIVKWLYARDVAGEGWADLRRWPELVPTAGAVAVHVLQNMLFGVCRIRFREPGAV